MIRTFSQFTRKDAQTAIELAVFGAILMFIVGITIRSAMNQSYQQNHAYQAMRQAMLLSHQYTEGLRRGELQAGFPIDPDDAKWGTASRNTATVVFVEDRLTADSSKFGTVDRTPLIASASATHSRNLFLPVDPGEIWNLPVMDIMINGQRFPLTTAGFRTVAFNASHPDWDAGCGASGCVMMYERVPNHPAMNFNPDCASCFDLDRDGEIDVDSDDREFFAWQWQPVAGFANNVDVENNVNTRLDVDGDLKEESILRVNGSGRIASVLVIDQQAGDFDLTHNTSDSGPPPGLTNDVWVFTENREGTFLLIEQGPLFGGDPFDPDSQQVIRTTQEKNQIDLVQRVIQLSNNTGRFCSTTTSARGLVEGLPNPVEVCGNCFSEANIARTCMDTTTNQIFVRSRIADLHGRKWITDVTDDEYVDFITE